MKPLLPSLPWILLLATPGFAQERGAILDAPLVVVPSYYPLDHLLDWDGDGWMDFVAYDGGNGGFLASLNDHRGGLSPWEFLGLAERDAHLETCDANLDGRDDLLWVVPSLSSSTTRNSFSVVAMPRGRIPRRFPHLEYRGPIDLGTILDADLDGDADRVRVLGSTVTLELFSRDDTGAWVASASTLTLGFEPEALVRMDCDGDAYGDLYLHGKLLGAFVPLGGGRLQAASTFRHDVPADMPMALPGDVDGDGDQDLAIFDMHEYRIHRRVGPASWTLEPARIGGPAAKLADVDGDGDLDGVCCSGGGGGGGGRTTEVFVGPSTFRVSLNDGAGGFAPAFTFPGLGSREIAGAADLDHDGDVDLVAGRCIYYARGPLTHPPQRLLASPQSPRSLFDFDRDGDADFSPGIGTFARHRGDGTSHAFTLHCPAPPSGTSDEGPGLPGDWDGDRDIDLVVRRTQGAQFLEMRLLVNEGGGTYADGGVASAQDLLPGVERVGPETSFAVDLDGDGDLDLATFWRATILTESWTRTWLNDGRGRFTFAWQRDGAWPLGFGELRSGGTADALLVHLDRALGLDPPSVLQLHRGLGDGSFEGWHTLEVGLASHLGPASIALEDFDLDGDLDLAGVFDGRGYFIPGGYFIPNVDGGLSRNPADWVRLDTSSRSGILLEPRIAVAGDVNGDGLKDVILSTPESGRAAISIVRRAPDNSGWLAPVHQVVYSASGDDIAFEQGSCLDLDGDGDAEYVTDEAWTNTTRSPERWGSRRQDASGLADVDGRVPTLGATGPFRPGERGRLNLTGAPPAAPAVLSIALPRQVPWTRGIPARFEPLLAFHTSGPDLPGAGWWRLAFRVPNSLAGLALRLRVDVLDPRQPRPVRSNELELRFGD